MPKRNWWADRYSVVFCFQRLAAARSRQLNCSHLGMNFWLIFFAVQVFCSVVVVFREPKEDRRYDGDKFFYRS